MPVGSRVTVHGKPDPQGNGFIADKVAVYSDNLPQKAVGAGLLSGPIALTPSGKSWSGTVDADGYHLTVTPDTEVTLPAAVTDPAALPPNSWVKYKADWHINGKLVASQIAFCSFGRSDKEQKFAKSSDFRIDPPDYDKGTPGKVHFVAHTMTILADRQLADHVTKIGESLVPDWQKKLADNDPEKVHFRFYILESSKTLKYPVSDEAGTVLVPANMLARLKNDAQLAALIAADVGAAIGEYYYQTLRERQAVEAFTWGGLATPFVGPIVASQASSDYWEAQMEHEYRVGMACMAAAEYDMRQAPEAIRQIEERHPEEDEAKGTPPPRLAAYVEFIYATTYGRTDWSGKQVGESEYGQLLATLKTVDPKAHVQ
ncbi:MAG: hypothetical protein JOZ83_05790 [Silvibacterium sp.]|nr:hypothetical protein [Silvibacterium sp.]